MTYSSIRFMSDMLFPKPKREKKSKRLLKPQWVTAGQIKTYDDAVRALKRIDEGQRRAEKSAYEAILTQVFQKWVRIQGDCVLRNTPKSWRCGGDITAGHVFARAVKQYKWSEVNCYPQCSSCNNMHQYYPFIYEDWLLDKIGKDEFEKMKAIVRMRPFFDLPLDEVQDKIFYYLEKICE